MAGDLGRSGARRGILARGDARRTPACSCGTRLRQNLDLASAVREHGSSVQLDPVLTELIAQNLMELAELEGRRLRAAPSRPAWKALQLVSMVGWAFAAVLAARSTGGLPHNAGGLVVFAIAVDVPLLFLAIVGLDLVRRRRRRVKPEPVPRRSPSPSETRDLAEELATTLSLGRRDALNSVWPSAPTSGRAGASAARPFPRSSGRPVLPAGRLRRRLSRAASRGRIVRDRGARGGPGGHRVLPQQPGHDRLPPAQVGVTEVGDGLRLAVAVTSSRQVVGGPAEASDGLVDPGPAGGARCRGCATSPPALPVAQLLQLRQTRGAGLPEHGRMSPS
jgi:hypothetical protein